MSSALHQAVDFFRRRPSAASGRFRTFGDERLEDVHVRFYDTIAIVTGRVDPRDNSRKIILQTQFTDVFHWEDDRWRAVSSQETPLARDSAPKP